MTTSTNPIQPTSLKNHLKHARTLTALALIGSVVYACSAGIDAPPAPNGFKLEALSAEKGLSGSYTYENVSYDVLSNYQGGVLAAIVSREGQELARVQKRDGQAPEVFILGHKTETNNATEPLEATTGPLAEFALTQDAKALKLLALESTCLPGSELTRILRQSLQMPLFGLQRYGTEVFPPDLEAIAARCDLQCNSVSPNADLFVTCGGAMGRARPISDITDAATGEKQTYLASEDCFGACGGGCVGCTKTSTCNGGVGYNDYDCYVRQCCTDHDTCVAESWAGRADVICHATYMPAGCTPFTAFGWDSGDPTNRPISYTYRNDDACAPPSNDNYDDYNGWWDPAAENSPEQESDGTCSCMDFTVPCDFLCPGSY